MDFIFGLLDFIGAKSFFIGLLKIGVKIDPKKIEVNISPNIVSLKKHFTVYNDTNRFVYDVYVLLEVVKGSFGSDIDFAYRNFDKSYIADIGYTEVNYSIVRIIGMNSKNNDIVLFKIDNIPPTSHIQISGDFTTICSMELSIVDYKVKKTDDVIENKGVNVSIPFMIPKKIGDIKLKSIGMQLKRK